MESYNRNKGAWAFNNGCFQRRPQNGPNFITGFHHRAYLGTINRSPKNLIGKNRKSSSLSHFSGIPYLTKRKKEYFTARPTYRRKIEDSPQELLGDLKKTQILMDIPQQPLNQSQENKIPKYLGSLQENSPQRPEDENLKPEINHEKVNYLQTNKDKICHCNKNVIVPVHKATDFMEEKILPQPIKSNLNHSTDFNCHYDEENYEARLPREILIKKIMNNLTFTEEMLRNGTPFNLAKRKLQINHKNTNQLRVVEEFSNLGKRIEKANANSNSIKTNTTSFGLYNGRAKNNNSRDVKLKLSGSDNVEEKRPRECIKSSLIESIKAKILAKQKEVEESYTQKEKLRFPKETQVAMRMMFNNYKNRLPERKNSLIETENVIDNERSAPKRNENVIEKAQVAMRIMFNNYKNKLSETENSSIKTKNVSEKERSAPRKTEKVIEEKVVKSPKTCKCLPCHKNLLCQRGAHSGYCKLLKKDEISNICEDCLLPRLSSVNFEEDVMDLLKIPR